MQMNKHRAAIIVCVVFLLFAGGTCDHTALSGKIVAPDTGVKVGEPVPLILEVPEELSGIYRVEWEADPEGKGKILYGEQLLDELTEAELSFFFGEAFDPDRAALFTAEEAGTCTISVSGFYKQTNPQNITSIDLTVVE